MAGTGGYQRPTKAAVMSGPGSLSARTDGGVLDPDSPPYGEGAEIASLKSAAPLAGGPGGSATSPQGASMADAFSGLTGLGAPSGSAEPVTSGAAAGAGPGPQVLGLPLTEADEKRADVRALPEGMLAAMILAAGSPSATPSFKRRVREVLANS